MNTAQETLFGEDGEEREADLKDDEMSEERVDRPRDS